MIHKAGVAGVLTGGQGEKGCQRGLLGIKPEQGGVRFLAVQAPVGGGGDLGVAQIAVGLRDKGRRGPRLPIL